MSAGQRYTRGMAFRAAAAQFTPTKGEIAQNLDRIGKILQQAAGEAIDLVVFPETIVSGYFLEGGTLELALTATELFQALRKRVSGTIDAVVGFYESAGGNLYNSAAYLQFGPEAKVVHVYRKFFLPTYGVFDEERFVSRGHELGVFDTRLGRMGVLICEDVWHSILPTLCAVHGAQAILVPSASPGRGFSGDTVGNLERYGRMLRAVSDEHGVYCVNAQLCGFEGGKGFVGGSSIVDPTGRTVVQAPIMEDALVTADLDLELIEIVRAQLPLTSDLQSAWGDIQRIVGRPLGAPREP